MSTGGRLAPAYMRAVVGDDNYRDIVAVIEALQRLEERGIIGLDMKDAFVVALADELALQQAANEVAAEVLTGEAACPETPTPCGH